MKAPEEIPNVAAKMIIIATITVSVNIAPVVIGNNNGSFATWREVEKEDTKECHPDIAPLERVTNRIGQIGPRLGWKLETSAGISKTILIEPLNVPSINPITEKPIPIIIIHEDM